MFGCHSMTIFVCYLIILGIALIIAGITGFADHPNFGIGFGVLMLILGSFVGGIRVGRGCW